MLEHMHKTMFVKDGKHGMCYEYLLTKVFKHFEIPFEHGVRGTVKQTISLNTLIECESVEGKAGNMSKVSELLIEHEQLKHELESIVVTLANGNAEIACLHVQVQLAKTEGPGGEELASLKVQNEFMETKMLSSMRYFSRTMLG